MQIQGFGQPEEAEYFATRYPKATGAIDQLYLTAEKVFCREGETADPADRIGFFLGRICVEEFGELSLLAVNGYGIGALKILRTMYERAVHASYIFKHPELADLFLNYDAVHKRKALNHLKRIFGRTIPVPDVEAKVIEEGFKAVEANYTEVVCATCGKTRLQGSWTKTDLASMANDVGDGYGEIYYDCYYKPTLQAHTTVASLESRLTLRGGILVSREGARRGEAHTAIIHGHNLVLKVLEAQDKHFGLGLDSELMERKREFVEAY